MLILRPLYKFMINDVSMLKLFEKLVAYLPKNNFSVWKNLWSFFCMNAWFQTADFLDFGDMYVLPLFNLL
jgi:hypothetical protein